MFSLVLQKMVVTIDAEEECLHRLLQVWYLDDGVLAGNRFAVLHALHLIEELGPHMGLSLIFLNARSSDHRAAFCSHQQ